jgi:signal transduction histidine kinase
VAYRWRFRHKLILAHGLVVAIVLLMLCGTIYGLGSYRTTTRTFNKKLVELSLAEDFRAKVKALQDGTPNLREEAIVLVNRINAARKAVQGFRDQLEEYTMPGQNMTYGWEEDVHAEGLQKTMDELADAINSLDLHVSRSPGRPLVDELSIKPLVEKCNTAADALVGIIRHDLQQRMMSASDDYKLCLWFVLSITGIGIVLMTGSLRFFYRWIFFPIRDLQLGVDKVAKGDFKHNISIQSSDEIQDLAAAFNDMTRRLDEMYADLAHQVNDRSRQLVRSERLASVGFLAAGVAHEINNPLASIAFCSEALERRILDMLAQIPPSSTAAEESKVITKYLKMIQQESFRCKEITSRLLEFSRGGEPQREPTDLCELVQNVLDMVQHLQNRQGKDLLFNPAAPVVALVNALEIKSVIVNLVVNALDSMEEGGTLSIHVGIRDGMAEMIFQDSGCGMSGEVLENIFEPFYTRSRSGKGTGLGLSICHRIISHHQGEIEAHSDGPNQGSTFMVRLPLRPADEGDGKVVGNRELRVANTGNHFGETEQALPPRARRAA